MIDLIEVCEEDALLVDNVKNYFFSVSSVQIKPVFRLSLIDKTLSSALFNLFVIVFSE